MSATKNAHDWHCEDHGTYGWRGEACNKCPKAEMKSDRLERENAQMRAVIAEQKEVIEQITEDLRHFQVNAKPTFDRQMRDQKTIAEQVALIEKLAEALEFCSGTSYIDDAHRIADEALAAYTEYKK